MKRLLAKESDRVVVHQQPGHDSPLQRVNSLHPLDAAVWLKANIGWFLRSRDEVEAERRPYPDPVEFWDSGIYFLFTDILAYVGQSNLVARRVREHAEPMTFGLPCPFKSHAVIWCPRPLLHDVERFYIEKFDPEFNMSRPGAPTYLRKYL